MVGFPKGWWVYGLNPWSSPQSQSGSKKCETKDRRGHAAPSDRNSRLFRTESVLWLWANDMHISVSVQFRCRVHIHLLGLTIKGFLAFQVKYTASFQVNMTIDWNICILLLLLPIVMPLEVYLFMFIVFEESPCEGVLLRPVYFIQILESSVFYSAMFCMQVFLLWFFCEVFFFVVFLLWIGLVTICCDNLQKVGSLECLWLHKYAGTCPFGLLLQSEMQSLWSPALTQGSCLNSLKANSTNLLSRWGSKKRQTGSLWSVITGDTEVEEGQWVSGEQHVTALPESFDTLCLFNGDWLVIIHSYVSIIRPTSCLLDHLFTASIVFVTIKLNCHTYPVRIFFGTDQ